MTSSGTLGRTGRLGEFNLSPAREVRRYELCEISEIWTSSKVNTEKHCPESTMGPYVGTQYVQTGTDYRLFNYMSSPNLLMNIIHERKEVLSPSLLRGREN